MRRWKVFAVTLLAFVAVLPVGATPCPEAGKSTVSTLDKGKNLPFAFKQADTLPEVRLPDGRRLPNPWSGGLNAIHAASVDLDGDGQDDYVLFDRIGSRVSCFSSAWEPLEGMEFHLPALQAWVQSCDYNHDGKKDLFTFNGISGIRVYRNDSYQGEDAYELVFTEITDGLPALMFGSSTALYCTNEDFPVIADIDGDGDYDVLNFWVPSSGDFLLYYRNYAQESLGRADTFCLELADWSWGCFVESEESNQIFLDSCSSRNEDLGSKAPDAQPDVKHAGSTMFGFKNTQSGLYDIVLGDVGYPQLYYLQNGGTPEQARITSYDTVFPLEEPVRLYNFPVISHVYYQDTQCYLFSPFETDPFNAEGSGSVWRYRETGSGVARSRLVEKDFLQNTMLDFGAGAVPVAFDWNQDGKEDLVVANYGKKTGVYYEMGSWQTRMVSSLALLTNTGTGTSPAFVLETEDFLGLSSLEMRALYPAFSDLDGDGNPELLVGMEDGRLWLFRIEGLNQGKLGGTQVAGQGKVWRTGTRGLSPEGGKAATEARAVLLDSSFLDLRLSAFSAPVFFDLNQDGLQDLVVGERQHVWSTTPRRTTKGSLTYFENQGPAEAGGMPVFLHKTDSLGGVDVIDRQFSNFGYSRPSFFRDGNGETYLACGSENGEIFLYGGIDGNLDGRFTYLGKAGFRTGSETIRKIQVGIHAAPLLHDFTGDGLPELLVGNQCGGLQYFSSGNIGLYEDAALEKGEVERSLRIYPNPVRDGFHVELPCAGFYRLCDAGGRILEQGRLEAGSHYRETETWPSGIYFWQFFPETPSGKAAILPWESFKLVKP